MGQKSIYSGISRCYILYRIDLEFKPPTKIDVSSAVYHASLRHFKLTNCFSKISAFVKELPHFETS